MPIVGPGIVRSVGDGDRVRVDPSSFDGNLTSYDDTVQKALDRLDDVVGSGSVPVLRGPGNPNRSGTPGQFGQKFYDTSNDIFYICNAYPSGVTWVTL